MNNHTGGKWVVRTTVDNSGDYPYPTYDILAIHDYGPEGVATAYQNPHNARLISAAPVMFEALERAVTWMREYAREFDPLPLDGGQTLRMLESDIARAHDALIIAGFEPTPSNADALRGRK